MNLEQVLTEYGYLALVVGCFLEGETILVLGGFAAHRGYLDLRLTMLAAFAGSVLGDQLYFFIGRRYGPRLLERKPGWQRATQQIERRLGRHRDTFIFGFRFLYGLRTVSPFVIAVSGVSIARFTVLNVLGAAVWSVAFAGAGYLFGQSVELLIDRVKHYELQLFVGLGAAGLAFWSFRKWRSHRGNRGNRGAQG